MYSPLSKTFLPRVLKLLRHITSHQVPSYSHYLLHRATVFNHVAFVCYLRSFLQAYLHRLAMQYNRPRGRRLIVDTRLTDSPHG